MLPQATPNFALTEQEIETLATRVIAFMLTDQPKATPADMMVVLGHIGGTLTPIIQAVGALPQPNRATRRAIEREKRRNKNVPQV